MEGWIVIEFKNDTWRVLHGGGKWYNERRWKYLGDNLALVEPIFEDARLFIGNKVESGESICVRFNDVTWVIEDGFWDLDFGYIAPDAWIEAGEPEVIKCDGRS